MDLGDLDALANITAALAREWRTNNYLQLP
jgi:hypothetical protein